MGKYVHSSDVVSAGCFFRKKPPWPEGVVQCGSCLVFQMQSRGHLFPLNEGDWIITKQDESRYTCPPTDFEKYYVAIKETI